MLNISKFLKNIFFPITIIALIFSCSSDSEGEDAEDKFTATGSLEILFDGVQTEMKALSSLRYGDKFMIYGDMQNGYYFQIEFHKSGALGHIMVMTDSQHSYTTTQHFSSNYMSFNLLSVDESAKKIKANFSGKIFVDNSEDLPIDDYKEMTGEFEISYQDMEELYRENFNCKIDNTNWYRTYLEYFSLSDFTFGERYYSDNAYRFRYTFDGTNIAAGTYSYTSEDDKNSIKLEKFDPITNTYLVYDCEGEITFSNIQNLNLGANEVSYDAAFHLTATNPGNSSDVIEVTNGNTQGKFSLD